MANFPTRQDSNLSAVQCNWNNNKSEVYLDLARRGVDKMSISRLSLSEPIYLLYNNSNSAFMWPYLDNNVH